MQGHHGGEEGALLIRIEAWGRYWQAEAGHLEPDPPEVTDMPQPMVVPAEVGFVVRVEPEDGDE